MKLSSLATAGLTTSILSILAGAIVRATGSGDGCGASWPTCNGRVIPSLETSSEIIEFSHRSISGVLLIVTLLLFVIIINELCSYHTSYLHLLIIIIRIKRAIRKIRNLASVELCATTITIYDKKI